MIRKTKHPSNRGERLAIKAKKAKPIHDNASPVYRLLKEKERIDAEVTKANSRDGELHP